MKHNGILISHTPKASFKTKPGRARQYSCWSLLSVNFEVFLSLQCWIWRISSRCKYVNEMPKCFDRFWLRYFKNFPLPSVRKVRFGKVKSCKTERFCFNWIKPTLRKIAPWKQSRVCTCCVVLCFHFLISLLLS